MLNPYNKALVIPCRRVPERLVKKETVNGIKGKTQGVIKAISPPKKPSIKMPVKLLSAVSSSPQSATGFFTSILEILILAVEETPPSRDTEKLKEVAG